MNISHLRQSLTENGLPVDQFDLLSELAANLPETNIAAVINGLNETESATLVSSLLRRLAPTLGVKYTHTDVLGQLGFPLREPAPTRSYDEDSAGSVEVAAAVPDMDVGADHYVNGNAG